MSVYTLDIDSSERDPTIYPNPADYVIELKNPIYDVNKISIASARIHASQLLINDRNNTFAVTRAPPAVSPTTHVATVYSDVATNINKWRVVDISGTLIAPKIDHVYTHYATISSYAPYAIAATSVSVGTVYDVQLIPGMSNLFRRTNNPNTVTLANGNYKGTTLAAELQTKLTAAVGETVTTTYNSDNNTLTFDAASDDLRFDFYGGTNGYANSTPGYTTPHDILGLPPSNTTTISTVLTTGSINLQGPDALVIKISSGAEEFNKTVYSDTPFYTGRILMCGDVINYSGKDDIVEHNFDTGKQGSISKLRVQFFYSSNNQLIPYDFRNANHIIKLSIEGSRDKLSVIPVVKKDFSLPDPIRIPEFEDPNRWNAFIYIFMIIVTGIFFLIFTRPRGISV